MTLFQRDRRRTSMRFMPRGDGLEDRFLLSANFNGSGNGNGNIGSGNGSLNGNFNHGSGNGSLNGNFNFGSGNGSLNGNFNWGSLNGTGNGNGNVSTVWVYSGPQKVHHSGHLHLLRPLPFQLPVNPAR